MSQPARPGPLNLITDVAGLRVGQAEDPAVRTGVSVIVPDRRAVCACDVRGGGPGTRETDALAPDTLVDAVDAVVLSGGSVYGLAAADGVTGVLGEAGRGFALAPPPARGASASPPPSPVVPAAILFDLANGGDKAWGRDPPYRWLGMEALESASPLFALGTAGAGFGALAGSLKGGLGSASAITLDGLTVGALVAVNSFGSVIAPGSRRFWAEPFEVGAEFGGLSASPGGAFAGTVRSRGLSAPLDVWGAAKRDPAVRESTTLACVAVDVALTPAEARRLAIMAQDGLARAIRPVHTPFDGDVVFALAIAARPLPEPRPWSLARLGALAADVLARAVARGVFEAKSWPDGPPAWRDLPPDRG